MYQVCPCCHRPNNKDAFKICVWALVFIVVLISFISGVVVVMTKLTEPAYASAPQSVQVGRAPPY